MHSRRNWIEVGSSPAFACRQTPAIQFYSCLRLPLARTPLTSRRTDLVNSLLPAFIWLIFVVVLAIEAALAPALQAFRIRASAGNGRPFNPGAPKNHYLVRASRSPTSVDGQ